MATSSRWGTVLRQKYSLPGGKDETKSGVPYPMHALERRSPEEILSDKMKKLAAERALTRVNQKFMGGLYAE